MRKTDEIRGPSCLTNAQDDEPIFVLRANDEIGSNIVRKWADLYLAQKKACYGRLTDKQQAKFSEALRLADMMDAWRAAQRT